MSLLLKKSLKNNVNIKYKIIPPRRIEPEKFGQDDAALSTGLCWSLRVGVFKCYLSFLRGAISALYCKKHLNFRAIYYVCCVSIHFGHWWRSHTSRSFGGIGSGGIWFGDHANDAHVMSQSKNHRFTKQYPPVHPFLDSHLEVADQALFTDKRKVRFFGQKVFVTTRE